MAKRRDITAIFSNPDLDDDGKVKAILDLIHNEVDTVKDEKDELQAQITKLTADIESHKGRAEKAEAEFQAYKTEQGKKEAKAAKEAVYKSLLSEAGIKNDKALASILKATDWDSIELDEAGAVKDASKALQDIKTNWEGFISAEHSQGQPEQNPPAGGSKGLTRDEIRNIKDATERRRAIAENPQAFGK